MTLTMPTHIESTAVVDPRAELDDEVRVGPFCVVGPKVRIGRGTHLINNVTVMGRVSIGQHNRIFPGAVLGGDPQDISYRGSDTEVVIGDDNVIREGVTINRATGKRRRRHQLGSPFIMAGCHIAHDCHVGSRVIMANAAARRAMHAGRRRSGRRGRAPLQHDRQLQLHGRPERVPYDAAVCWPKKSAPRCINIGPKTPRFFSRDDPRYRSSPLAVPGEGRPEHARELLRSTICLCQR
jgi:UDP-N-acetylglucosamine acyltransferase